MEEQREVPQIRFKGFTDDWEQRKLGDIATIIGGGTPSTEISEYWNGNINWYSPAEIGTQIYVKESQRKITKLGLEKSSAKLLPIGTVLFTSRAGIGNTAILKEKACTNQGFQSIIPAESLLDSYFIFSRSDELKKYAETVGAGSTFVEVSGKQMSEMQLFIPEIIEQKKISELFENIDNLITLHQRKCDKLIEVKKSLLEKMFPKNSSKIPEIRFKGFTDDWEQRKLDEITDVRDGTHDSPKYLESGKAFITSKNVRDGNIIFDDFEYISEEDFNNINKRSKVDKNDILMGMIGTIGNIALIKEKPDFAIKNVALIKDISKINYLYNYYALQSQFVINQMNIGLDGGTQKFLSLNKIRELNIMVPLDSEQSKIGELFTNLDNLITLHQRKLEKLKEVKKSMLEKMFV